MTDTSTSSYSSMKIAQLKAICQEKNISIVGMLEKSDFVKALEASGRSKNQSTTEKKPLEEMKISELKKACAERGINTSSMLEKSDMIQALQNATSTARRPRRATTAPAASQASAPKPKAPPSRRATIAATDANKSKVNKAATKPKGEGTPRKGLIKRASQLLSSKKSVGGKNSEDDDIISPQTSRRQSTPLTPSTSNSATAGPRRASIATPTKTKKVSAAKIPRSISEDDVEESPNPRRASIVTPTTNPNKRVSRSSRNMPPPPTIIEDNIQESPKPEKKLPAPFQRKNTKRRAAIAQPTAHSWELNPSVTDDEREDEKKIEFDDSARSSLDVSGSSHEELCASFLGAKNTPARNRRVRFSYIVPTEDFTMEPLPEDVDMEGDSGSELDDSNVDNSARRSTVELNHSGSGRKSSTANLGNSARRSSTMHDDSATRRTSTVRKSGRKSTVIRKSMTSSRVPNPRRSARRSRRQSRLDARRSTWKGDTSWMDEGEEWYAQNSTNYVETDGK